MDPELQKRIDAARAQGFTDEEIQQSLSADTVGSAQPEAAMPGGYNVPILSQEEKALFQQNQQQVEASNRNQNFETGAVAAGLGAAAVGVPAALLYGAKKIISPATQSAADLARRGVGAMESQAATSQLQEQRLQNRPGFGGAAKVNPVAPTGAPTVGPVAPVGMAAANEASLARAAPASMTSRVQTAAANMIKNLPGAGALGSAGRVAGKLLPGVGTALNAADAYNRYQEGDTVGAGIAGVGAAASPFPILGTAVGAGTGAINAYRDYLKRQEEEKKRMMK